MPPIDTVIQEEFSYTKRETSIREDNEIEELISKAQSQLNKLLLSPTGNQVIQAQLDKINSLKRVLIPTREGVEPYYSMMDNAGGVTEKTCLIDEVTLKKKLEGLANATNIEGINENKIQMNAILKHPKAEKDTEVQREAIGLGMARILGFEQVTDSTLVYHDTGKGKHPCLFVPFGKMKMLTDFIEEDGVHRRLKGEHFHSTEDFGKYSAFFMLSGDPDFIGKDGQNKGLIVGNSGSKQLYLFDQVFMATNNFGLDRSFNLVPTNLLSKLPNVVARHFMGRNKSVINDSSFEEKIQGAIEVLQKKEDIKTLFESIAQANPNLKGDPVVKKLQKDAKDCLKSFNSRVRNLEKLFPPVKVDGTPKQVGDLVKDHDNGTLELLKKSMLLTQLINKPKLYDKSGKPYRAPFFTNPSTYVKQVSISGEEVTLSFARRFGPPLSENKKALLKEQGFVISKDGKSATISKEGLLKINEQEYFEEQKETINPKHNYIDSKKIANLANTYNESDSKIQSLISKLAPEDGAGLQKALKELDQMPFKNKDFKAHVKQCFLYEAMKVIIKKNPGKEIHIVTEFQEAKKEGKLDGYVQKELNTLTSKVNVLAFKAAMKSLRTSEVQSQSKSQLNPTEDTEDTNLRLN